MINNSIERTYIFLFSSIPISIIIGPSISLINVLTILVVFLVYTARNIEKEIFKNPVIIFFYTSLYLFNI